MTHAPQGASGRVLFCTAPWRGPLERPRVRRSVFLLPAMSEPLAGIHDDDDNEERNDLVEDETNEQDSESPDDTGLEKRKIFTDKSDPPIGRFATALGERRPGFRPIFQRRAVWDDVQSSKLIESLILEVPLPVIYLAEASDGQEEVIDGQQRLNAFFRFLQNRYSLKGLKALPQLNGSYFKDLDKPTQKLVRGSSVRTITFKKRVR